MKKKNELEAELLSAENPLQLIKTDYFSKVILELGSSFLWVHLHWIDGVKLLRDQLVNTSSVFNTMLGKKAQEINDLIDSYNGLLAVHSLNSCYS